MWRGFDGVFKYGPTKTLKALKKEMGIRYARLNRDSGIGGRYVHSEDFEILLWKVKK